MPSEIPATPRFTTELEAVLRRETARRKRSRRPFAASALARLRRVSTMAGHVGAAVVMSATFLMLSPATIQREVQLPATAEPPRAGYLAQYGASASPTPSQTITLAREAGFEVEVITTFVADRASHGAILSMRHMIDTVNTVPVNDTARGPLFIFIGLTVGEAGTTAD
jgi:hypothetical protein